MRRVQNEDCVKIANHRELGRRLSAIFEADPIAALALPVPQRPTARRIGFSGPPGAGKSSLIAAWAALRLAKDRRVGVVAVDPSSPFSQGCLLGDRIRMDGVTDHPGFYLRSVASRGSHDGLCPNATNLLDELERVRFDDVVIETVGVGQSDYTVRFIVDTFVTVLSPEGGDVVQAMKAGILEVADILIINKADLPAAKRMARDVAGVVELRANPVWRVPVIEVSPARGTGLEALDAAVDSHGGYLDSLPNASERSQIRQRHRLQQAIEATLGKVLGDWPPDRFNQPLPGLLAEAIDALRSAARSVPSK
jgi:LAO/AO transport system kinase